MRRQNKIECLKESILRWPKGCIQVNSKVSSVSSVVTTHGFKHC